MMRWIDGRPRMWYGWTDMGPIQIPALPQYIVLTDRVDGLQYVLTHTLSGGVAQSPATLSTTIPSSPDKVVYGPNDGPYIQGNPTIRLYSSSGVLVAETVPQPLPQTDIENQQVFSRNGNSPSLLLIGWDGSALTYTVITA